MNIHHRKGLTNINPWHSEIYHCEKQITKYFINAKDSQTK